MNYRAIYNDICNRGKDRKLQDVYTEKHHIIPKCCGGLDVHDNITHLTAKEHFICHKLLCKLYPDHYGLSQALLIMSISNSHQQRYIPSAKEYAVIRERAIRLMTKYKRNNALSGDKNGMYGVTHTDETKKKQSEIRKRWHMKNEHPNKGNVYSDQVRDKISKIKTQQWSAGTYDVDYMRKVFSIRSKRLWSDTEYAEKILKHIKSDKNRSRMSKFSKMMWDDPEMRDKMLNNRPSQKGGLNNNARGVYDPESGKSFGSRLEASEYFGVTRGTIYLWIKNGKLESL